MQLYSTEATARALFLPKHLCIIVNHCSIQLNVSCQQKQRQVVLQTVLKKMRKQANRNTH